MTGYDNYLNPVLPAMNDGSSPPRASITYLEPLTGEGITNQLPPPAPGG